MQARHAEPQTYLKSNLPDIVYSFKRQIALVSLEATTLTTLAIRFQKGLKKILLVLSSVSCPAVVSPPPCATGCCCCCLQDPVTGSDGEHPAQLPVPRAPTRKVNSMQSNETDMH